HVGRQLRSAHPGRCLAVSSQRSLLCGALDDVQEYAVDQGTSWAADTCAIATPDLPIRFLRPGVRHAFRPVYTRWDVRDPYATQSRTLWVATVQQQAVAPSRDTSA